MARFSSLSSNDGKVILNVYDLQDNDALYPLGLGFYHSGVQIGRDEYTFAAEAGIFSHGAKQAPGVKLRESIEMGIYKGTQRDLEGILNELRNSFKGTDYHVLCKNCNSFADAFLMKLLGVELPGYVNRMAFYGSFFSCLLPDSMNQDPTQQNQYNNNNGLNGNSNNNGGNYGFKMNETRSSTTTSNSFIGTSGTKLGGSSEIMSSNTSSSSTSGNGLVDRRERMRQAALNRMQQSSS